VSPILYFEDIVEGTEFELGSTTVTREEILEFAVRFDPQPFHVDEEAAKESMFGGLIASGWHTAAIWMRLYVDTVLANTASLGSPGVEELRWLKPVRPGDTLTGWVECAAKVPSKSRPTMGVIHEQWLVTNQKGEVVMTTKGINMVRRRPQ
jgi:acyl dehydratase